MSSARPVGKSVRLVVPALCRTVRAAPVKSIPEINVRKPFSSALDPGTK
jgi:hypothetical protein